MQKGPQSTVQSRRGVVSKRSPVGSWLARIGKAGAFVVCVLALAALGLRTLYSTQLGFIVAYAIPASVWRWLDALYGPADGESANDTEAMALASVSLLAALCLVTAVSMWISRRSRRRS